MVGAGDLGLVTRKTPEVIGVVGLFKFYGKSQVAIAILQFLLGILKVSIIRYFFLHL
ncbi:MAG TPA: hypothetical protein V6D15_20830 [Oculatellaceae cyanobacterium]|jgi:hypothetical protein